LGGAMRPSCSLGWKKAFGILTLCWKISMSDRPTRTPLWTWRRRTEGSRAPSGTLSRTTRLASQPGASWPIYCCAGQETAHPTGEQRRTYRALRLGRANGGTLLTELLPYPHPKRSDWLYGRFGRYQTREAYSEALLPARVDLLRCVLDEAHRELVVCYGKDAWAEYSLLFDGVTWIDDGRFRRGMLGATRIVLTPHFSGRDFNTDEQLAALANVALDQR
jgi:hypothetical protein